MLQVLRIWVFQEGEFSLPCVSKSEKQIYENQEELTYWNTGKGALWTHMKCFWIKYYFRFSIDCYIWHLFLSTKNIYYANLTSSKTFLCPCKNTVEKKCDPLRFMIDMSAKKLVSGGWHGNRHCFDCWCRLWLMFFMQIVFMFKFLQDLFLPYRRIEKSWKTCLLRTVLCTRNIKARGVTREGTIPRGPNHCGGRRKISSVS